MNKPNKASQATLTNPATTCSCNCQKASQTRDMDVQDRDNPFSLSSHLRILKGIAESRKQMISKYGLREASFMMLLDIADKYVNGGSGSTCWGVSDDYSSVSANQMKIHTLREKGYIEVVGYGSKQSYVYAPTGLGLEILRMVKVLAC